jgi:hypothetical protein
VPGKTDTLLGRAHSGVRGFVDSAITRTTGALPAAVLRARPKQPWSSPTQHGGVIKELSDNRKEGRCGAVSGSYRVQRLRLSLAVIAIAVTGCTSSPSSTATPPSTGLTAQGHIHGTFTLTAGPVPTRLRPRRDEAVAIPCATTTSDGWAVRSRSATSRSCRVGLGKGGLSWVMAGFVNVTRERCPRPAHRWQGRLRKALS